MTAFHPLQAAHQPDPADGYRQLAARQPFYRDPALSAWVAAGAEAVHAVLHSPLCGVRPLGEPVPATLLGTPLAPFFARLIRQNDGALHGMVKPPLQQALAQLDDAAVTVACDAAWAAFRARHPQWDATTIDALTVQLPVRSVAQLLGIPADATDHLPAMVQTLVDGLAPGATSDRLAAAGGVVSTLQSLLGSIPAYATPLRRQLLAAWPDPDVAAANLVALLQQTHDATAALLATLLYRLAGDAPLRARLLEDAGLMDAVMAECLRRDAPVQHTRRYVLQDGRLCGQAVKAGEMVLVLLAAANLDPAVPDTPLHEDAQPHRREHGFGAGVHRCPGQALALQICREAVARCLREPLPWAQLGKASGFRPVANARWRRFAGASA